MSFLILFFISLSPGFDSGVGQVTELCTRTKAKRSLGTRETDSWELQSVKRMALFAPFFSPSPTLKPVAVQSWTTTMSVTVVTQAPEDHRKQPVSARGTGNKGPCGLKRVGEIQWYIFIFILLHLVSNPSYAHFLTVWESKTLKEVLTS